MTSSFVLCAYFAIVLSPCVVATYGDLFSLRWILALARRRRTHGRMESFHMSVRHERYVRAVAQEAAFAAAADELLAAPRPFLVPKQPAFVETPAFVQGRRRVAARFAQIAVANQLRTAAEAEEKIATSPADAPSPAELVSIMQTRAQQPESVTQPLSPAAPVAVPSGKRYVIRKPALTSFRDLVETYAAPYAPPTAARVDGTPPTHKPCEPDVLDIAA